MAQKATDLKACTCHLLTIPSLQGPQDIGNTATIQSRQVGDCEDSFVKEGTNQVYIEKPPT